LGDASFYDSANRGLERAVGELGVTAKAIECGYDPANYVPYLAAAAKKFDLVIVVGFGMYDALEQVAPKFPDTSFVQMDMSGDLGDVTFANFRENEGSFLAGALAALMTTREGDPRVDPSNAIIGAVLGEDIPVLHNFLVGYRQGAEYINPDVQLLIGFVGRWDDPAGGKEMALNQHKNGADVIFQIAGGTGEGVLNAAQDAGFWAIGVDAPQELFMPQATLTSMLKRMDTAVFDLIQAKIAGELPHGATLSYGLKDNGVGLSWTDVAIKNIPEDVATTLREIEQKIVAGEIVVKEYAQ
jgi:basic membrane protein A